MIRISEVLWNIAPTSKLKSNTACTLFGYILLTFTNFSVDIFYYGHREFWACCVCHEQFLEEPLDGNFVDAEDSNMVGGLDSNHIAYLPSELELLAKEAVVKSYSPHSYFEEKGTYAFDIIPGTTNLITTNATVEAAYATLETNAVAHKANRAQVEEDIADYRAVLVEEYGKSMVQQVTNVLRGTYGVVNQGVLKNEVNGSGYVDHVGKDTYSTFVAIDPTNTAWGTADNRYWTPQPYMGSNVISYAESVRASLTTMNAIEAKLDALMVDAARAAAQFIMEVELYHAFAAQGYLSYNGDHSASEWWFVWNFHSDNSTLSNVSCNDGFDPSSCSNYRLCAALFDPDNKDFSTTLSAVISMANYIIVNQVDDMYKEA